MAKSPLTIEERFWTTVEKTEGCWNWAGTTDDWGYGRFNVRPGERAQAHRYSYELLVGPIPDGLTLDHLCRNRSCVNPAHLEPVTGRENILRGTSFAAVNAVKTHCPQGHEYTDKNTYIDPRGCRRCRICRRSQYGPRRVECPICGESFLRESIRQHKETVHAEGRDL